MSEERFLELAKKEEGFEMTLAFQDDVDHILGGKENIFWYTVLKKGKIKESFRARMENGLWTDTCRKGSGKKVTSLPSGTTISRIARAAYLGQEEKWVAGRKPRLIEDAHPHFHYVYGFGDRALDISEKYGVTISYNDIKDPSSAFRLRALYTGSQVELP